MEKVWRCGQAGLIASAIEADVEHVELIVGAKDDGVVDRFFVEFTFGASGSEDELGIFEGGAIGRDGICRSMETWRLNCGCGKGERGIANELPAGIHDLLRCLKYSDGLRLKVESVDGFVRVQKVTRGCREF